MSLKNGYELFLANRVARGGCFYLIPGYFWLLTDRVYPFSIILLIFNLLLIPLPKLRLLEPASQSLYTLLFAADYRQYSKDNIINNRKLLTSRENRRMEGRTKRDWESERRRLGEPVTCDRGQVRVGTRFAFNEDEVSCLPAVRRRVWTCVCEHRRSSEWGVERYSSFCRLQNDTRMVEHLGSSQIIKMFKCTLCLRQTDTNVSVSYTHLTLPTIYSV